MGEREGDAGSAARTDPRRAARRGSRFWLFAPFVLLGLVVVAWSAAWFLIRDRIARELDDALGAQAALGRSWTCEDRRIAGFPFRIEIGCAALRLRAEAEGLTLDLGPARAVAQVYQPRHVIVSAGGPFLLETPEGAVTGDWDLMEASIRNLGRGTEQLAVVIDAPRATVDAAALPTTIDARADRVELYARPSPGSTIRDGALDLVVRADALRLPALDAAVAGAAPADVEAQLRATGLVALAAGRGDPERAARAWREVGGRLDIQLIAVETEDAALEIAGELGLDDLYRPEGRIEASGRGLGPIAQDILGGRGGFVGDAIVAALGGPAPQAEGDADPDALRPLPPVRLEGGRVFVGPFPVPQVTLEPVI
jgi:hypothetical protein